LQVLRLVAEGKTSKDIAVLLDLGLQTVRGYRKMLMKKLGVNNVAGLHPDGIGRRPDALEQTRCKLPGVISPSATRTSTFSRPRFSRAGGAKRAGPGRVGRILDWRIRRVAKISRQTGNKSWTNTAWPRLRSSPVFRETKTRWPRPCAFHPDRFWGFFMANPIRRPDGVERVQKPWPAALQGVCLFPAMHRYAVGGPARAPCLSKPPRRIPARSSSCIAACSRWACGGSWAAFAVRYALFQSHRPACRRHGVPQVNFVIPHFGAGYFREALMLCDLCPNVYLDTSSSNSWVRYQTRDARSEGCLPQGAGGGRPAAVVVRLGLVVLPARMARADFSDADTGAVRSSEVCRGSRR
jgi:hypothetical protein